MNVNLDDGIPARENKICQPSCRVKTLVWLAQLFRAFSCLLSHYSALEKFEEHSESYHRLLSYALFCYFLIPVSFSQIFNFFSLITGQKSLR